MKAGLAEINTEINGQTARIDAQITEIKAQGS